MTTKYDSWPTDQPKWVNVMPHMRALARAGAVAIALLVGLDTARTAHLEPQWVDQEVVQLLGEAAYWAGCGGMPNLGRGDAAAVMARYGDRCGLTSWTHHPPLPTYWAALFLATGLGNGQEATADFFAAATVVLIATLAWRSLWGALVVALVIEVCLHCAPGYSHWLTLPYEDTWAFPCLYLLAAACAMRRPLWPTVAATAVAAGACIASSSVHVAVVAGVLIAAHGVGWVTIRTALAAVAAYVAVFALHVVQVWCHTDWQWSVVRSAWFDAGLAFRVAPAMSWAQRWQMATTWDGEYVREVVVNQHGAWSTPELWLLLFGCAALAVPTMRGVAGAGVFVALMAVGAVLHPNLLPPHLHMLPRYVLLLPIGVSVILAAGTTERSHR